MSFHIGQKVVCVNAAQRRDSWGKLPESLVRGAIYTIRDVYESHLPPAIGVRLEEIQGPFCPFWREEIGFHAIRFRPVRETNIDVFTKMLEQQPAPVEA